MRIRKKCRFWAIVFLIVTMFSSFNVWSSSSLVSHESQDVIEKFNPDFWKKIQEMKAEGVTENVSLIIWLSENQAITNMSMEDLKIYATSVVTNNHNANVFVVCRALPVIIATVGVDEVESIATYDFVERVGDGNEPKYYPVLDVSKKVIRGEGYLGGPSGYNGSGLNIAIIDSGINSTHPDLGDLDDDPNTNDPKVTQEICFVDWNNDSNPDFSPMDNYGHGTHVAGIAAGTGKLLAINMLELRLVLGCGI